MSSSQHYPSFLVTSGGRLRVVPVLHGRMELAVEVRRAWAEHRPTDIVLDLPVALTSPLKRAVARLPLLSVIRLQQETRDDPSFFLVEPTDAVCEAARLAVENNIPLHCGDRDGDTLPPVSRRLPDPHAIETIGLAAWAAPCLAGHLVEHRRGDAGQRLRPLAYKLTSLLADPGRRILFVCSLPRTAAVLALVGREKAAPFGRRPALKADLFHLHPDATREVMGELPNLAAAYERWRQAQGGAAISSEWPLKRRSLHLELLQGARQRLLQEDGERISTSSLANLLRWTRNLSMLEGALAPDFYTLVLGARGVGGDEFAWRVWDMGSTWPWVDALDGLPTLRLTLEDLARNSRRFQFQRRIRRRRSPLRLVKPRHREPQPGIWKERWSGMSMCSHPPEDLIIEGYGQFLAHKARGLLAADRTRVEPFSVSLLDGIDFRETIRNRLHDSRVYVQRRTILRGRVGSVVLAFDAEDREKRYTYCMTWQGEHNQESDMALYATHPGEQLVGPGIARCEYGGFLMTWPPGRMFSVWEDPEFLMARTPAERLLLAGIDYAEERLVVYVADRPPRSFVHQFAARRDRKVLYLPIGQLSPGTLARLRVFHVLDGREVRAYARDFIN